MRLKVMSILRVIISYLQKVIKLMAFKKTFREKSNVMHISTQFEIINVDVESTLFWGLCICIGFKI